MWIIERFARQPSLSELCPAATSNEGNWRKCEVRVVKKSLIFVLLVAGCGGSEQPGQNEAGRNDTARAQESSVPGPAPQSPDTRLTGLYESGPETQRNQLCMVEKGGGSAQFGVVVWGANMHSCSGAGEAVREGRTLRLRMAGDSACEIRATIDGGIVTLPDALPEGCAYYCGARARFAGASLTRVGSTPADAMKATDLAGDPLCDAGSVAPG
jgi:hypothetical protein